MNMNRIAQLRNEYGIKQADLARRVGIAPNTLSNYENENRQLFPEMIRKICAVFGVTSDYLLGFSSFPGPAVSEEDAAVLDAYHALPPELRTVVDSALDQYKAKKITAAG